jgi:hypothetical protein
MEPLQIVPKAVQGLCRREVLKAGLIASAALSTRSLSYPPVLWGAGADTGER